MGASPKPNKSPRASDAERPFGDQDRLPRRPRQMGVFTDGTQSQQSAETVLFLIYG